MLDRAVHVWGQLPLPSTHTLQYPVLAAPGVHALASLPRATAQGCTDGEGDQHHWKREPWPMAPCRCPLHYLRIWAHSLRPPFNTLHPHFLPLHPPFWPLPEPPHLAQVSTSSCPPLSCGSQGSSWQGQLRPQQLGPGWGTVGTLDGGAPCTLRDTPSSVQLLPGKGKEGGCHSELGLLGTCLTCPPLFTPHSSPLPGWKPVFKWRSLHPAVLPGGCLPVSAWLRAISGPCVGRQSVLPPRFCVHHECLYYFLHVWLGQLLNSPGISRVKSRSSDICLA